MRSTPRIADRSMFVVAVALWTWAGGEGRPATADDRWTDRFPNVTLRTQDNVKVKFYDDLIKNKTVLINFMYTQCDGKLCDRGTRNLAQVQKALGDRLGRDVFIYSISIDPENDTPEVLKAYAMKYGAMPGWTFLTSVAADNNADRDDTITTLRRSLGLASPDPELRTKLGLSNRNLAADAQQKQHSGMIVVANDTHKRWDKAKILARPDEILQMIKRLEPLPPPKK